VDTNPAPQVETAPPEVSLIRGGPFYRAQQATKLIRSNQWNLGRRLTFAVAVGWLPLFLITALSNPGSLVSLLRDYRVHSRMLIAVPVLLLGQLLMEARFRMVVGHFTTAGLLDAPDLARMNGMIGKLLRLRDSFLPELAILLLMIVRSSTAYKGLVDATPWLAHGAGADLHLTPAGWYAALVSAPIFQFLLGLSLWKWLLWTLFAFQLSRLNLKLVPTHPDEHGGLGFLGLTPIAFTPVALAATTAIGANWRHEILYDRANLLSFKLPALALVAIVALVALGPLVFFVPRLAALRRRGMLEYGTLGQMHSTDFHEKWIRDRAGREVEFLTAPEISTLCDYGQTYEKLEQLRPFPADREVILALAVSVVVPMLPTILAQIPLAVVLKSLLEALR
jgi:hypothetical protein